MIAFIDLETTGLAATQCEVLEVACIVTDDLFVEVARFEQVVYTDLEFHQLDEFIRDMHTKNGLWSAVKARSGGRIDVADRELSTFLRAFVKIGKDDKGRTTIERPVLAGNTISFDRAFMKVHLPNSEAELSYHNIDCSSFTEVARRFWPEVYASRPRAPEAAHRAMADIEGSIATLRHYVEKLGPMPCTVTL